ncbi:MAG: hypothetical protein JWM95_2495 [Gemmatimonadetes bacterium]|nr:hypothetical protein [Gemmatimonadota bacterium]
MQRPKQQALAFLLGALLVGAVVGFAGDRVFHNKDDSSIVARRTRFYDDLGLQAAQRTVLDSIFDENNCQMDALVKPLQPALDSLKAARRSAMSAVLTPAQRALLDARRKDLDARHDAERKQIKSACHK